MTDLVEVEDEEERLRLQLLVELHRVGLLGRDRRVVRGRGDRVSGQALLDPHRVDRHHQPSESDVDHPRLVLLQGRERVRPQRVERDQAVGEVGRDESLRRRSTRRL